MSSGQKINKNKNQSNLEIHSPQLRYASEFYDFVKRGFDLAIAVAGLILLWPLMIIVALVIRLVLGSPIIFMQTRPGFRGRPFRIFKFRTMSDACDSFGNLLPDGERLGTFGKFLRKLSLDELPQLFNVLKGDLSIVGPRPLLMEYLPLYTVEQTRRHDVKPGITGWAQVNGRNAISWEQKLALDVWYVDHRSVGLDARIVAMTFRKVLRAEGVSQVGEATMDRFLGAKESEDLPNSERD